ncbi:MAG: hypothetical protein QM733_05970 [Ilumatobacteraceae bacterium]
MIVRGVRIAGWLAVDGTIVGDGPAWHQVRCSAFPGARAFMAVATEPARLAARRMLREPTMADPSRLLVRLILDHLASSTAMV